MTRGTLHIVLAGLLLGGLFAWGDSLITAYGAEPPVPWAETARLAGTSAALLAPAFLVSLAILALFGARLRGGRGRRASRRPAVAAVTVSAFWIVFFGVMERALWKDKWWWKAALWAVLAAWAARRLARLLPERDETGSPEAAPMGVAVAGLLILWTPMALLPSLPEGAAPVAAGPGQPPSFLLVVIDTLRADHLGSYGYLRPTSPVLDDLAARGFRFENVVSPSSWTLPAMASILTSTYPGRHGADRLGTSLPREMDDLATRLRSAGYRTASFNSNPWLRRRFGFHDGFDDYYDQSRLGLARNLAGVRLRNLLLRALDRIRDDPERVPAAGEVTRRAESWLRRNGDRPFLLYLHYMDVHAPYLPPEPFLTAFCKGHDLPWPDHRLEHLFRQKKIAPEPEVLEHVLELYDGEILATDSSIGRLLESMEALGLLERTHLIVTADHGEEFYDHGGTRHSRTLYREVVRVPLIWVPPGSTGPGGRVVERRVTTLDIFPTLLSEARLPIPEGLEGRPLFPVERPEASPRPIGSQLWHRERPWTALYLGGDKMIRVGPRASDPGAGSRVELYRLETDPGEREDVAAQEPDRAAVLLELLERYEAGWGPAGSGLREEEAIDAETLEQLKALGYVQ